MNKMIAFNYDYSYSTGAASFGTSSSANSSENIFACDCQMADENKPRYSIFDVANWFLNKEVMTHKKLQKLCYYAQAWCYAIRGYRLTDGTFEAWIHGPVSPVLYDKFKAFGYGGIRIVGVCAPEFAEEDVELLESVWDTYGDHTGNALEALSHSEPPWKEARIGYSENERCNVQITPDSMKRYYSSIYIGDAE